MWLRNSLLSQETVRFFYCLYVGDMRYTEKEKCSIVNDYKNGMCPHELGLKYSRNDSSIINMLKAENVFVPSKNRWTQDDVSWLKDNYAIATLEEIRRRFPDRSLQNIYTKAYKLGIPRDSYHWTDEDEKFLLANYFKYDSNVLAKMLGCRYTPDAIRCKANKMGMKKLENIWTQEEDDVIRECYPKMLVKDFIELLPGRTVNSVIIRARKLGVTSHYYSNVFFSDEECLYIKEHWREMSDIEIAESINRGASSVKGVRNRLGFHRVLKDYTGYADFDKLFRGQISEWKKQSMVACDFQCVITHDKDFQVHHVVNFKSILNEAYKIMDDIGLLKSSKISNYSAEEIDKMIEIFRDVHSEYPLGVCVRKDLHDLFHSVYGRTGNSKLQWDDFVEKCEKGIYKQ